MGWLFPSYLNREEAEEARYRAETPWQVQWFENFRATVILFGSMLVVVLFAILASRK